MIRLGNYVVIVIGMAIFLEFIGIPTGLSLILSNFGIDINTNTTQLVTADIESSPFWSFIFGNAGILIIIAGGGAVIVGLFAKSYDTSLVILPLIVFTAGIIGSTWWTIIQYVQNVDGVETWAIKLVTTIFAALAVGFIWSCVDYFAGR